MKRPDKYIVMVFLACLSAVAFGHGAGYEPVHEEAAAVRFAYVLGQPMTGAEVRVLPPGSESAHQVGRADRDGRFAFVPDRPGEWTVIADDGAGHRVQARVSVSAAGMDLAAPRRLAVPPSWLLAGLMLSLLINAGLISVLLASRKKTA